MWATAAMSASLLPRRLGSKLFHAAALAAGAQDEGAPWPQEKYRAPYYGCFVRDPDGHKIEGAFWDESVGEF